MRRSLMEYDRELEERATPVVGLTSEPMSPQEEALIRAHNVVILARVTTTELAELDEVAREYAVNHDGTGRDLPDMFISGLLLAKYMYFRETLESGCLD